MQKVLEGLKAKQIMKNEDFLVLREYIGQKYPDATPQERAAILANAVHSVIDRHIQDFNEKDRAQIRISLIKKAVSSNHFSIHAGDVFRTSLEIRNDSEEYTTTLAKWVSRQQNVPITRETLLRFSGEQHRYAGELLEHNRIPVPGRIEKVEAQAAAELKPAVAVPSNVIGIRRPVTGVCVRNAFLEKLPVVVGRIAGIWRTVLGVQLAKKKRNQVLAASLIVMSMLTFQPLKNMLAVSFGSTASSAKKSIVAAGTILPEDLLYRTIDTGKLATALNKRKSILADEPYLSSILQAAREYNVNPLFLFAITGQEQAFVPRTDKDARRMANNPFNVYHSWMEYNTDILDSARIAAVTVTNLSQNRPETVNPVAWINRKYAEDNKWWMGVSQIFSELRREVEE